MNIEEQLQAVILQATVDSEKWHSIIHGSDNQSIETENGNVPTVAKQLKDVRDEVMSGVIDYLGECQTARDITLQTKTDTLALKNDTTTLKAETLVLRNEAENFKNLSQTTFNNIASAISSGVSTIQTESTNQQTILQSVGTNQVLAVNTAGAQQIALATAQADRAEAATNSKLDVELTNMGATFKETVLDLTSPNYNQAVGISTPYTAPKSGWIMVRTSGNGNYCNLTIDGFDQIATGGNFSNYHEADTTPYRIGKGSVASWSGNCNVWFIPCQGA